MCVHCMADGRACLVSYLKRNQKRWRLVKRSERGATGFHEDDLGRFTGMEVGFYLPTVPYICIFT